MYVTYYIMITQADKDDLDDNGVSMSHKFIECCW